MVKVDIVNVVATASLNQTIDFNELVKCREIIYSSNIYGGRVAYFKTEKMLGKVSIFLSGWRRQVTSQTMVNILATSLGQATK